MFTIALLLTLSFLSVMMMRMMSMERVHVRTVIRRRKK